MSDRNMSERGTQSQRLTENQSIPPDARPLALQPRWRRDFPIDWEQDEYVSRRELVKFMVLTSAAFAVGQAWLAAKSLLVRRAATPPPAHPDESRGPGATVAGGGDVAPGSRRSPG